MSRPSVISISTLRCLFWPWSAPSSNLNPSQMGLISAACQLLVSNRNQHSGPARRRQPSQTHRYLDSVSGLCSQSYFWSSFLCCGCRPHIPEDPVLWQHSCWSEGISLICRVFKRLVTISGTVLSRPRPSLRASSCRLILLHFTNPGFI